MLGRKNVESAQGINEENQAENNPDDFVWLPFDEHTDDVKDDVKNESGDKK